MINTSKIKIGYSKINSLLEEFGIEYNINKTKPIKLDPKNISSKFFNTIRRGNFSKGYKECRNEYDYDFLLSDGDIFLFEMWQNENSHVSKLFYLYLESPYLINTYNEYLISNGLTYSEDGNSYFENYLLEIDDFPLKESMIKIHYDYFPDDYQELIHPASHIHIGNRDDVRIPIKSIWSPVEFVCFCLKITKYDRWKTAIKTCNFSDIIINQKSNSIELENNKFSKKDECEYYFR